MGSVISKGVLRLSSADAWEDCCTFARADDNQLAVSVSEEKSVDSHNLTFECTAHLMPVQIEELRAWLEANFPSP